MFLRIYPFCIFFYCCVANAHEPRYSQLRGINLIGDCSIGVVEIDLAGNEIGNHSHKIRLKKVVMAGFEIKGGSWNMVLVKLTLMGETPEFVFLPVARRAEFIEEVKKCST